MITFRLLVLELNDYTVHGGEVSGNASAFYGGGMFVESSTFAMHGGGV